MAKTNIADFDAESYAQHLIKEGIPPDQARAIAEKTALARANQSSPSIAELTTLGKLGRFDAMRERAKQHRQQGLFEAAAVPLPTQQDKSSRASAVVAKKSTTKAVAKIVQDDLFVTDLIDPNFRDEQDMLEAPMLSLDKRKRTQAIEFHGKNFFVAVSASARYGMATIWDWDFMLWAASQINEAIELGRPVGRTLHVQPHTYFVQTGKGSGKGQYTLFESTLDRLQSTTIKTDIKAAGEAYTEMFSWIDSWRAIRDPKGRLTYVEVTLSEWFFARVATDRAVLSIDPDYFSITSGIKRWLYRIARKSAGSNPDGWRFSARQLHDRYPSGREFRKFKSDLKSAVLDDDLPEYQLMWIDHGKDATVEIRPRPHTIRNRQVSRKRRLPNPPSTPATA